MWKVTVTIPNDRLPTTIVEELEEEENGARTEAMESFKDQECNKDRHFVNTYRRRNKFIEE